MHPYAPPVVALPAVDGPAGADPDMARWLRTARYQVVAALAGIGGALLVTVIVAVAAARDPGQQGWAVQVISLGLLAAFVLTLPIWPLLPSLRYRAVLAEFGWRPVTAKVVRGGPDRTTGPCVLLAAVGDEPAHLRVPGLSWPIQRIVLATGRVWLAGPDRRGRAMLRVDGSAAAPLPATVVRQVGAGQAPTLPAQSGDRPIDDPQVRWMLGAIRQRLRLMVRLAVLLAVVGAGALIPGQPLSQPIVGAVVLVAVLAVVGWYRRSAGRTRPVFAQVPVALAWTPVPVREVTWTPNRSLVGPINAVVTVHGVDLPVTLPIGTPSLVANLRAGGQLWVIGEPAPGAIRPVGLPGHPVLGTAVLGGAGDLPANDVVRPDTEADSAIADPETLIAYQVRRRTVVHFVTGVVACGLILLGLAGYAVLQRDLLALLVIIGLGLLGWDKVETAVKQLVGFRVVAALVQRFPWRESPAELSSRMPTVVTVASGETVTYLRFRGIEPPGVEIIRRTGRLWLCGPDERGRVVAWLAGLSHLVSGWVTDAAPPLDRPRGGSRPEWPFWFAWGSVALACVLLAVGFAGPRLTLLPVAIFAALQAVNRVGLWWARRRWVAQLRRLRASGPWTEVPASLDTWRLWRVPVLVFSRARGRLRLPDGREVSMVIDRCNPSLLANIRATGKVWVAGTPTPGTTIAVGVPGHPVIGVARLGR